MAYVRVADPKLDIGYPGRSTDMIQLRDNQDWFDSLLDELLARSNQDINDNFAANIAVMDSDLWVTGGDTSAMVVVPANHLAYNTGLLSSNPDWVHFRAAAKKMHIAVKTEDHHVILEARVQKINAGAWPGDLVMAFGFQDSGVADTALRATDVTDFIGFIQGTNAETVSAICALGGATAVKADNQGTLTNYTKLKIDLESSSGGTVWAIDFYVDDVQVGTTHTDGANVPSALLSPSFAIAKTSGADTFALAFRYDFVNANWQGQPAT